MPSSDDQELVCWAAEVILDAVFQVTTMHRDDDDIVNPALVMRDLRDQMRVKVEITDADVDAGWMTVREAKARCRKAMAALAAGDVVSLRDSTRRPG